MDYFSAWKGAKWWPQRTAIESGPYRMGGPQGFFTRAGDQEFSPGYHKHDPWLLPKETKGKD